MSTPLIEPARDYTSTLATIPTLALDTHERSRVRAAAFHAKKVLPDALGQLVSRELLAYEEFGFRFQAKGLSLNVVDEVLAMKIPD